MTSASAMVASSSERIAEVSGSNQLVSQPVCCHPSHTANHTISARSTPSTVR